MKIIAAFLDFYCSGNVGEWTKFLPREGAIDGQNKGEEEGKKRGVGILETIEQQSMKINRHVPNNLMLLEIPLWRS